MALVTAEAWFVNLEYDRMRATGYRAYELAAAAGADAIAAAGLVISCQGLINVEPEVGMPRVDEAIERAQRANSPRVEAVCLGFLAAGWASTRFSFDDRRATIARMHELAGPNGLDHELAISADAELRVSAGDARGGHGLYEILIDEALARGITTSGSRIALGAACASAEIPDVDLFHRDVQLAVDEFHRAGVHRAAADLVMVLGYFEACNGDPYLAAELLAVSRKQELFDMRSYGLWQQARDMIRMTGSAAKLDAARERGSQGDVATTLATELDRRGLHPRPFRSLEPTVH